MNETSLFVTNAESMLKMCADEQVLKFSFLNDIDKCSSLFDFLKSYETKKLLNLGANGKIKVGYHINDNSSFKSFIGNEVFDEFVINFIDNEMIDMDIFDIVISENNALQNYLLESRNMIPVIIIEE